MRHVVRVAGAAVAVLALAVVPTGPASARTSVDSPSASPWISLSSVASGSGGQQLPSGWRFSGTGAGKQLVWVSPEPVPMGDARVEFYAGDTLLGRPVASRDRRSFRLPVDGSGVGQVTDLRRSDLRVTDLRVVAAGRRLDAAGDAAASRAPRHDSPALPSTPLPALQVDPGAPGSYRTRSGEYTLPSVRLPGFPAPVEMRATVVGPVGAPGKRPLALFLHGRHYTCFSAAGEQSEDWPCAPGTRPVPSHQGYLGAQKLLASQGYATVSISANGINAQDHLAEDDGTQARSSLVRLHLARWADWGANRAAAPAAVRAVSSADLKRVLLVGHSRGGEGVNRASLDSLYRPPADQDGYGGPVRWNIRGNVLIGPTIFGQNPAPDVPTTTILPGCDGDVADLAGQIYADGTRGVSRGAALHSVAYMVGANHNFFNSEWTPGQAKAPATDDFWSDGGSPDPVCDPGTKTRLTAARQQAAGATYIAASARLFVAGDDRVRPLLDGSGRRAPSADPARVLTHAVGGNRTPAFLPGPSVAVDGGRLCAQVDPDPARACLPSNDDGADEGGDASGDEGGDAGGEAGGGSPHFASWETPSEPGREAVAMRWSKAGAATRVRSVRPVSLAGSKELALRVIVPPNTTGTQLDVGLVDTSGRRATLGRARVDGLPGSERTASHWAREVRVPLSAATAAGLDLKRVKALELTPRNGSGQAWLMDAWGYRPGTPAVVPAALPRVDIGRLTVGEGDSGVRHYRVPVRVSGKGSGQIRLFVPEPGTDEATYRTVTVRPGTHDLDVPVEVRGNTRYAYGVPHDAFAKTVRGAVVGSHRGGVTVRNDDPMPKVTLTPVADQVTEGSPLTWRMSLSEAADVDISGELLLLPVTEGTEGSEREELSTTDVEPRWLADNFGQEPEPARPLSTIADDMPLYVNVPAGALSAEVSVPTVEDGVSEGEESLKVRLTTYDEDWEPQVGPVFTGTVRDAS
ncbi:hypothetical protein [Streptomyces sp. NPDC088400]|uniref:hypothetical protein n=1 Tax=Streptomyces sp. NPDC088400 TaxID=3365861 RepID=UPI00380010EE